MPLYGRKPIGTVAAMAGVPAVLTDFWWSWGQMVEYNARHVCEPNEYVHYDRATVSFHSWARNDLAGRLRGDWLFMLDTDHAFEPDLLGRLLHRLHAYDLDVITGVYTYKHAPHPPVLYGWMRQDGGGEGMVPLGGWGKGAHVFEVAGAGGGCLLVRRRVFDRIRAETGEEPFDVIGQGGEDLGFFHRLRRLGIKAWADDRVECHHLVARRLSLADYDPSGAELAPLPDAVGHVPDPGA